MNQNLDTEPKDEFDQMDMLTDQVRWAKGVFKSPDASVQERKLASELILKAERMGFFLKARSRKSILGDLRRTTEAEQEEL